MTISDQRAIETLIADHVPLVGYAVTELTGRLPQTTSREPLVAAGMDGLRAAAHSYKGNRDGANDFVPYARAQIAAALCAAVAGVSTASRPPSPADGPTQVAELLAQLEPALGTDEELLLHTAHRAAFAGEPQRPSHGAGYYAAAAAAADARSSVWPAAAAQRQRKFGT